MGQTPSWGIELSVGLRSPNAPLPTIPTLPQITSTVKMEQTRSSRSLASSDISNQVRGVASSPATSVPSSSTFPAVSRLPAPTLPHRAPSRPLSTVAAAPLSSNAPRPLSPSRVVSVAPHTKARDAIIRHPAGRKRKGTDPPQPPIQQARSRKPTVRKASRGKGAASSSESESFPDDISGRLYNNPESLTKEQAERLLESPAFLSMLSKLTGQPITTSTETAAVKREREEDDQSEEGKRRKLDNGKAGDTRRDEDVAAATPKCWNCGRTKSAVWRMKVMDDGKSVRVCNGELHVEVVADDSLWTLLEQDAYDATSQALGRSG